jgi:hypothetical protein
MALTNHQICLAFIDGETTGRAHSMRIEAGIDGKTHLYSYNEVIAVRSRGGIIMIDTVTRYSQTTTQQVSKLTSALVINRREVRWHIGTRLALRNWAGLSLDTPITVVRKGRHTFDGYGNRLQREGW